MKLQRDLNSTNGGLRGGPQMTWTIILFILGVALGREYANMKFRNRNQIIFYRLSKSAKSEVVKIINEMDD